MVKYFVASERGREQKKDELRKNDIDGSLALFCCRNTIFCRQTFLAQQYTIISAQWAREENIRSKE